MVCSVVTERSGVGGTVETTDCKVAMGSRIVEVGAIGLVEAVRAAGVIVSVAGTSGCTPVVGIGIAAYVAVAG